MSMYAHGQLVDEHGDRDGLVGPEARAPVN